MVSEASFAFCEFASDHLPRLVKYCCAFWADGAKAFYFLDGIDNANFDRFLARCFDDGVWQTIRWYADNRAWWEPLRGVSPVVEDAWTAAG